MIRSSRGFTVVELVVVVVVVGVLVALTAVGFSQQQSSARDTQRDSAALTVQEALEKYYQENGEYPSVPALTNSNPNTVANLIKVDVAALKMPRSTTDMAIAAPGTTNPDAIIYAGQNEGSAINCQTNTAIGCDKYEITYKKEIDGTITIKSRYSGASYPSITLAPSKPTISVVSNGGLSFKAEASQTPCALQHTAFYSFRIQPTNPWTAWQPESIYITTGAQGTSYEVQAQTRCDMGTTSGPASEPSNSVTYTTPVNAPAVPTVSVALSGSNVQATVSTASCASGFTAQYAIRGRIDNGTWGAYSAWSTTRTSARTAEQGVKYSYQAQARCYSSSLTSAVSTGTAAIYTHPISAPPAPSVAVSTSGSTTTYTIGDASCPSGTTAQYQYQYVANYDYVSAWYGPYSAKPAPNWGTTSEGYTYTTNAQARCMSANTVGGWSTTGSGSYTRPVTAPGIPTNITGAVSGDRRSFTWNWTAPSCGPGALPYSSHNPYINGSSNGSWYWLATGQSGWYGWGAYGYYIPSYTITQPAGMGDIPVGGVTHFQVRYYCINTTTGLRSADGPTGTAPVIGV